MHRSNSVLLNALRSKLAAASILQQAETDYAMEQELFQSQHASTLEHRATAQQYSVRVMRIQFRSIHHFVAQEC